MDTILEVNKVYKYFGGVKANENISLTVEQGSIVGLNSANIILIYSSELSSFLVLSSISDMDLRIPVSDSIFCMR